MRRRGEIDPLSVDVGIGVEALDAGELLIGNGYEIAWHQDQHPEGREGTAWGIPVTATDSHQTFMDDGYDEYAVTDEVVSYGDAKKSIGRMLYMGSFWLDPNGLHLERDPQAYPDQVDVDHVLARLGALGVPDKSLTIEIRARANKRLRKARHAYFVINVDMVGVEHLATIFDKVESALSSLRAQLRELETENRANPGGTGGTQAPS